MVHLYQNDMGIDEIDMRVSQVGFSGSNCFNSELGENNTRIFSVGMQLEKMRG